MAKSKDAGRFTREKAQAAAIGAYADGLPPSLAVVAEVLWMALLSLQAER